MGGATVVYAAALGGMALAGPALGAALPVPRAAVGLPLMLVIGAGWVAMVVVLNVAAQSGTPPWVRGRALAAYFTAFFGTMAAGSVVWGAVAGAIGLAGALGAAAGTLLLGLVTLARWRLAAGDGEELSRSASWEDPVVSHRIDPDDGPVVVTIEYEIDDGDAGAFAAAMQPVRRTRYRDGAMLWVLSRDTERPGRWLEVFLVESWAEHLRQHERVTVADSRVQEAARAFHRGAGRPVVRHFIAATTGAATTGAGTTGANSSAAGGAGVGGGLPSPPGALSAQARPPGASTA